MLTTRITKGLGTALYTFGIFFLMFLFQKTYDTRVFFIDYRYTYANMVVVFVASVVLTAVYYYRHRDMLTIGRVAHYMSVAVVVDYIIYRSFFRDWVLHHFEYITDDYHFIFCAICLFGILVVAVAARMVSKEQNISFNLFYSHYIRGVAWLLAMSFVFVFYLNRQGGDWVYQEINLVPFAGELRNLFHMGTNSYADIHLIGNVVFFGVFSLVVASMTRYHKLLVGAVVPIATSILLEIYQYLSYHGDPDIDDVITNAVGAVLGIVAYQLIMKKLLSRESKEI